MSLFARPLSGYGRYVYECHYRSFIAGRQSSIALDRATQFILQGIRATFGYEYDNREGILLEKVLHNLDMPIQSSSYELI